MLLYTFGKCIKGLIYIQLDSVISHCVIGVNFHCFKKISTDHMASLLNTISDACEHAAENLNADVASSLAELAVNELVAETEDEAAELLIKLCKTHCTQATGGLLTKYAVIIYTISCRKLHNVNFFYHNELDT